MKKSLIIIITSALLISGCSKQMQPQETINKENTTKEHIQAGNDLQMIMSKFNYDVASQKYTQQIATLVAKLAQNSKELKEYSKNESELFIQYANEMAQDAQRLQKSLDENRSVEEMKPTLQNIERLCYQCHATLHE